MSHTITSFSSMLVWQIFVLIHTHLIFSTSKYYSIQYISSSPLLRQVLGILQILILSKTSMKICMEKVKERRVAN